MSMREVILFDIDNTLVFGTKAQAFYKEYSRELERTIASVLGVPLLQAINMANDSRRRNNGQGELVFDEQGIDNTPWYEGIIAIDPSKYLDQLPEVQELLVQLSSNYMLGAITDGPTTQADRILETVGIDKNLFSLFIGWERNQKKPKDGRADIYYQALKFFNTKPESLVMVGDSDRCDIEPAKNAGLLAIKVDCNGTYDSSNMIIPTVLELPRLLNDIQQ